MLLKKVFIKYQMKGLIQVNCPIYVFSTCLCLFLVSCNNSASEGNKNSKDRSDYSFQDSMPVKEPDTDDTIATKEPESVDDMPIVYPDSVGGPN